MKACNETICIFSRFLTTWLKVLFVLMLVTTVSCDSLNNTEDCPTLKLDLVIIVDTSTSVGEDNFILSLDFVRNILKPLPIGPDSVRVALLRYSTDVKVVSYMNEHMTKDEKIHAVSYINYTKGMTYTDKVLTGTRTKVLVPDKGDRSDARDLVILITDGQSTRRRQTLREAALLKRRKHLQLFAIGVTKEIDEVELKNISSRPTLYLNIETFTDLNNYLGTITPVVCSGGVFPEDDFDSFLETTVTTSSTSRAQTGPPVTLSTQLADQEAQSTDHMTQSNNWTTRVKVPTEKGIEYTANDTKPFFETTIITSSVTHGQTTHSIDHITQLADQWSQSNDQVTQFNNVTTQVKVPTEKEADNVEDQRDSEEVPTHTWRGHLLLYLVHESKFRYAGDKRNNLGELYHSQTSGHSTTSPSDTSFTGSFTSGSLATEYSTSTDTAVKKLSKDFVMHGQSSVPSPLSSMSPSNVIQALSTSSSARQPNKSSSESLATLNLTLSSIKHRDQPIPLDLSFGHLLHILSQGHCNNVSHRHPYHQLLSDDSLQLAAGKEGLTLNINIYNYNIDAGKYNKDV